MSYYAGEKCLICDKEFNESDDIVVCPECGTPYHRECYKEKGACINKTLHDTGGSWMADSIAKRKAEKGTKKVCPNCSCLNENSADICVNCGSDLMQKKCEKININNTEVINLDSETEYYGLNPAESMDDESDTTLGEVADYVRTNKLFYIPIFRRIRATGIELSLNIVAFLFPQYFFANRKMYLWTAVTLIAGFIFEIPTTIFALSENSFCDSAILLYFESHPISPMLTKLFICFEMIIKIIMGLFANNIYFRHIISKLKKIKGGSTNYVQYRMKIKEDGGTSFVAIIITGLVNALLALIFYGVLIYIAYNK